MSMIVMPFTTCGVAGAAAARPTNAIFPFKTSRYTTAMLAAKAFGVLLGFERKDPYVASGNEVGVVGSAPTFESYFHLEKSGGFWYVTSVTSAAIDVTLPKVNGDVGTLINVRALANKTAQYFATMQANDRQLTPGTDLKKSSTSYSGTVTSIGRDGQVGIYAGVIHFTPQKGQWGYVLVVATNPAGVVLAAESVRISN
jgi:hypothetical protein